MFVVGQRKQVISNVLKGKNAMAGAEYANACGALDGAEVAVTTRVGWLCFRSVLPSTL